MTDSTRRTFLIASGAGAAAIGMAAAVPATADARTSDAASATLPHDATDLVAHVADPSSGTVTLLVGEREVVVHDRDLVARLARAASRER
ncbi:hypothetical protein [Jatrophihabitans sp.]|uniref:hypothetical protein n=1 Tax=Jatrophihabitans sp. TaxID=1932789 RepID=UPI002C96BC95|nr:hypothetical protein [Jatrophihabitans sp.]